MAPGRVLAVWHCRACWLVFQATVQLCIIVFLHVSISLGSPDEKELAVPGLASNNFLDTTMSATWCYCIHGIFQTCIRKPATCSVARENLIE